MLSPMTTTRTTTETPKRQTCCECYATTTDYKTERTTDVYGNPHVWHRCADTCAWKAHTL